MEQVNKLHFLCPSIFNKSGLLFYDSSRNRLQILQLLRYGFSPIAAIRGKRNELSELYPKAHVMECRKLISEADRASSCSKLPRFENYRIII